MEEPNTLFLLSKFGLKKIDGNLFESHMWLIKPDEESLKYISLHKSKTIRAWKGGEITEIRAATSTEVEQHQALMRKNGLDEMKKTTARKVVVFRLESDWKALWPAHARKNPMAYKGTGHVDRDTQKASIKK